MDIPNEYILSAVGTLTTGAIAAGGYFVRNIALPTLSRLKKMDAFCEKINKIHAEVSPNGGGSLKDQVTQTNKIVSILAAKDQAQLDLDDRIVFQASESGAWQWVNKAFLRQTGFSMDEVLGAGWKNTVHPEDLAQVTENWKSAVADRREYHQTFRVVDAHSDTMTKVRCEAVPLLDPNRNLLGYLGYLRVD